MTNALLRVAAEGLLVNADLDFQSNYNETGYWREIARALEAISGQTLGTNANKLGYMRRAVFAVESMSGTTGSGTGETAYLRRIVLGMEAVLDVTTTGSWEYRLSQLAPDFTTGVIDITPPVLTFPFATATSETTALLSVSTDTANGTLYYYVSTLPTTPEVEDMVDGTGAAFHTTEAIISTGVKSANVTGLTPDTTYFGFFLHVDSDDNESAIAASVGFTTPEEPVITPGIAAPTLYMAVGQTEFPIELDVDIPPSINIEVYDLRIQCSTNETFTALIYDETVSIPTDPEDPMDLPGLAAIATVEKIWFRAWFTDGVETGTISRKVVHGDTDVPTITSATTTDLPESALGGSGFATANETCEWFIIGGPDSNWVTIDRDTGEWTIPTELDAGIKPTYNFVILAIDLAGHEVTQSHTVNVTAVDNTPDNFDFADETGASTSTAYDSDVVTITGLGSGVFVSWTATHPILYRAGGSGAGVLLEEGTAQNLDTFQFPDIMSSGSGGMSVEAVLTVGGVSGTFSILTAGMPQAASIILQIEPDVATLFQLINGTTPVTTTGNPVGYAQDQSSNANHLTAAADSTVRPLFTVGPGGNYDTIDFSAASLDALRRIWVGANALNLSTTSIFSIILAATVPPAANAVLVSNGSTASNNPYMAPIKQHATTAGNWTVTYRAGTSGGFTNVISDGLLMAGAFDNTPRVYGLISDGDSVTAWRDGVEQLTVPYSSATSSGLIDNITLGALTRTTVSNHASMNLNWFGLWGGIALTPSEMVAGLQLIASEFQGRTI